MRRKRFRLRDFALVSDDSGRNFEAGNGLGLGVGKLTRSGLGGVSGGALFACENGRFAGGFLLLGIGLSFKPRRKKPNLSFKSPSPKPHLKRTRSVLALPIKQAFFSMPNPLKYLGKKGKTLKKGRNSFFFFFFTKKKKQGNQKKQGKEDRGKTSISVRTSITPKARTSSHPALPFLFFCNSPGFLFSFFRGFPLVFLRDFSPFFQEF